jgi:hypothetical protein
LKCDEIDTYQRKGAMEIINLGAEDGLPPVEWAAITERF